MSDTNTTNIAEFAAKKELTKLSDDLEIFFHEFDQMCIKHSYLLAFMEATIKKNEVGELNLQPHLVVAEQFKSAIVEAHTNLRSLYLSLK